MVAALLYWIYYERIMFAEEDFLKQKFGEDFEHWAGQTPAFLPAFRKWKAPNRNFSVRKVIRREYRGLVAVIITFGYLNLLKSYATAGRLWPEPYWQLLLVVGLVLFITIRLIKKTTPWLDTPAQKQ
jgi:protein-S-isoprenylcysteine O-methyltransferase Ste14